jgi:hypothetical protein
MHEKLLHSSCCMCCYIWYNFMLNTLAALLFAASSVATRLSRVAAVARSAVQLPALAAAARKLT